MSWGEGSGTSRCAVQEAEKGTGADSGGTGWKWAASIVYILGRDWWLWPREMLKVGENPVALGCPSGVP